MFDQASFIECIFSSILPDFQMQQPPKKRELRIKEWMVIFQLVLNTFPFQSDDGVGVFIIHKIPCCSMVRGPLLFFDAISAVYQFIFGTQFCLNKWDIKPDIKASKGVSANYLFQLKNFTLEITITLSKSVLHG